MPSRRDIIKQSIAAGLLFGLPKQLGGLTPRIGTTARPHLDTALRAERWIRSARQTTPEGARWPADPLKPAVVSTDLYNGMAGVVLFYLELFAATGDQAHLREATAGADYLIARIPELPSGRADSTGARVRTPECGLYTGLAGTAYVLERTATLSGQRRYRDAMTRCLDLVQRLARPA